MRPKNRSTSGPEQRTSNAFNPLAASASSIRDASSACSKLDSIPAAAPRTYTLSMSMTVAILWQISGTRSCE